MNGTAKRIAFIVLVCTSAGRVPVVIADVASEKDTAWLEPAATLRALPSPPSALHPSRWVG